MSLSSEAAVPMVPPVSVSTARARTLALTTSSCKVHAGGTHSKKPIKLVVKANLSKLATSPLRMKSTTTRVASMTTLVEPGDMGGGGDDGDKGDGGNFGGEGSGNKGTGGGGGEGSGEMGGGG